MDDAEILQWMEQSFVDSDVDGDVNDDDNIDEADAIIKRAESFLKEYGEGVEERIEDILQRNDEHIEREEQIDDPGVPEPESRLVSDPESDFEFHNLPQSTPTTSKRGNRTESRSNCKKSIQNKQSKNKKHGK